MNHDSYFVPSMKNNSIEVIDLNVKPKIASRTQKRNLLLWKTMAGRFFLKLVLIKLKTSLHLSLART